MLTTVLFPLIFAITPADDSTYDSRQLVDQAGRVQGYYIETPGQVIIRDEAGRDLGKLIRNPHGADILMAPDGNIEGYLND